MDVGELPVYSGHKKENQQKPRNPNEKKDAWEEIGDYEDENNNGTLNYTCADDDDDEDGASKPDIKPKQVNVNEKLKADAAASNASKVAMDETLKHKQTA